MTRWTERQIEAWVSPETRTITMPDGSTRPFTMGTLAWMVHDDLVDASCSSEWLVRLACEDAARTRRPFEFMFPSIIAFVQQEHRKRGSV